jgi:hypothetical protein
MPANADIESDLIVSAEVVGDADPYRADDSIRRALNG